MTKNEVMQMALDVFTNKRYAHASAVRSASVVSLIDALALAKVTEANKELRAALAQPEPEPVAWMHNFIDDVITKNRPTDITLNAGRWTPLYTISPKREWVGLTNEEVMSLLPGAVRLPPGWVDTVRAIEAELKDKNT